MDGLLVACEPLAAHLDDPTWRVFDCRTRLGAPEWGDARFLEGHIPGALRADVDRDLSDPVGDGLRGRHPLPDPARFCAFLESAGVDETTRIVAYDDEGGWWASRLWWLARDHGLRDVAVLDGGWARWQMLGLAVEEGAARPRRRTHLRLQPHGMPTVQAHELPEVLLDARVPGRFAGDLEPVDPAAGHIPGARNVPAASLVGLDGRLLAPDELFERFVEAGAGPASRVACYCGSGVTATHLVLAMEAAGLPTPALYAGSWSAWCARGGPVETGPFSRT